MSNTKSEEKPSSLLAAAGQLKIQATRMEKASGEPTMPSNLHFYAFGFSSGLRFAAGLLEQEAKELRLKQAAENTLFNQLKKAQQANP